MRILHWNQVALPGESWHFAHHKCRPHAPISVHTHDFAEVFWIENGNGVHELNGRTEAIASGTLIFIRAEDQHGFHCNPSGSPFTIANFALPAKTAATCQQRWADYGLPRPPWAPGLSPVRWNLPPDQLSALGIITRELADSPITPLAGDRFLSALVHEIHRQVTPSHIRAGAPDWLARAITGMREAANLVAGLEAFYRLAGRSREHVTRTCRQHTGLTPTSLITQIRLEHARRLLERTDLSVLDVAQSSGFTNMSLFHRRFRAATNLTPLRYRKQCQLSFPVGESLNLRRIPTRSSGPTMNFRRDLARNS
jgi:AraC family cel operon transcriptional repressor